MGTTADKLNRLLETKTAIKEAIVAKGVSVADTDTFRSYADKISQIQSGGERQIGYWSMANVPDAEERILAEFSVWCKINADGAVIVGPTGSIWWRVNNGAIPLAIAVDFSYKTNAQGNGLVPIRDILPEEYFALYGYEKITEEEFYAV